MSLTRLRASSGTYNVRESELARHCQRPERTLICNVCFLDNTQHTFQIERNAKGQTLLDNVFQHLDLIERDYFGLQYIDCPAPDSIRWLSPDKKIAKQVKCREPYWFYFKVKFYVSEPSKLQEEYTRYFFFLQLKKDILEGRLVVSHSMAVLLASYAVQSELGDYNIEDHGSGYLSEFRFVPNQTEEFEREVELLHKQHVGQMPADAEFNYLDQAKLLDMYGVELHQARENSGTEVKLGVTAVGLVVFQNNVKINTFSWSKIIKISFKRKQFFIQLRKDVGEVTACLIVFSIVNCRSCKELWKACVEHHTFFRLHVPKPPTRRLMPYFGSQLRYSGKTELQALNDGKRAVERPFDRAPSKRYARRTVGGHTTDVIIEEKTADGCNNIPANKDRLVVPTNGRSTSAYIRPYESYNNKISLAGINSYIRPKKAWSTDDGHRLDCQESAKEQVRKLPRPNSIGLGVRDPFTDHKSCTSDRGCVDTNTVNGTENLVIIRMKPDDRGRFGFNVKGGCDQSMPVIVSRVAPNMPADICLPRLNEGDQVLMINGKDITNMGHDQVVSFIRSLASHPTGLVLTVRPNVYLGEDDNIDSLHIIPEIPRVPKNVPLWDRLPQSLRILSETLENSIALKQFDQLYRRKPGLAMNDAMTGDNVTKNRYRDVSPYDQTRVCLQKTHTGSYINASFVNMEIPVSGIVNRYIAAQGPLPNTCSDFWQMIWEQQSSLIVMLTATVERGRVKCHQYWPDLYETVDYGLLQVTCLKEEETPSFAFREFALVHLEKNSEERHIVQMQYISWPDHGVPGDSYDFIEFVKKVRKNRLGMVEPTVVHCSAGIGRTGVLITMETAMCLIEANEPIYPLDIVMSMREQRPMLIQTSGQYKFVCEAILRVYNDKMVTVTEDFK